LQANGLSFPSLPAQRGLVLLRNSIKNIGACIYTLGKKYGNIMNTNPFREAIPDRLYALQLKLRPLAYGTLMPFSGELVHGAWLKWIRNYAPDVATWLHDGNKRRLFTCSSLQFPLQPAKMRDYERGNVHLPVDPANTYTIRITLLLGELFPLFYESLMQFNVASLANQSSDQTPFIKLGKQTFLLEEVIANREESPWVGYTSFSDIVEEVKRLRLGEQVSFTLDFASLTTFNRSGLRQSEYSTYYARLPLPNYLFTGLVKRWQELAPPDLARLVQREAIEEYINNDGIIIEDYELKTHIVRFVNHPQRGFIGNCTYGLRGPDSPVTEETPLTVRQQILLLTRLAFYTGAGYKPAMGMGQCRLV
jgi:CRISPR-associated endoribonuclease Cas6